MKLFLSLALAASVLLSGCSIFQRSPTWDLVVRSRGSGLPEDDSKNGYINRLHQLLAGAGVEHKIVTYQYHWLNAYREEAVQVGVAIVYRDDTTPSNPWWITDEHHYVPTWVPNWTLDSQLTFFIQQRAQVISVKEYAASVPSEKQLARVARHSDRALAETRPGRAYRSLFAEGQAPRLKIGKTKKFTAPITTRTQKSPPADPLTAGSLNGGDARAEETFRSAHGTRFDPNSSVDREKMNELRRRLFSRNQVVRLRSE